MTRCPALLLVPLGLVLAATWLMLASATESKDYGGRIGVATLDCGRAVEHPLGNPPTDRNLVWTARPNADPFYLADQCTQNLRMRTGTAAVLAIFAGTSLQLIRRGLGDHRQQIRVDVQ